MNRQFANKKWCKFEVDLIFAMSKSGKMQFLYNLESNSTSQQTYSKNKIYAITLLQLTK